MTKARTSDTIKLAFSLCQKRLSRAARRRQRSCVATGRKSRCSRATRSGLRRNRAARGGCSSSRRATTSSPAWCEREGRRWRVRHGPFSPRDFKRLPRSGWTLLVQGVDMRPARGAQLLERFAFIPYARLDDVMVSYAPPGRRRRPPFRQLRRLPAAGRGPAALAREPPARSRPRRERAAQDTAPLPAGPRMDNAARATCSICRRAARTTGSRSATASPTPSDFALPARRSWARASSSTCRTGSASTASTRTAGCGPRAARPGSATTWCAGSSPCCGASAGATQTLCVFSAAT